MLSRKKNPLPELPGRGSKDAVHMRTRELKLAATLGHLQGLLGSRGNQFRLLSRRCSVLQLKAQVVELDGLKLIDAAFVVHHITLVAVLF